METKSREFVKGYRAFSDGVVVNRHGKEVGYQHPNGYVYFYIGKSVYSRDRVIATLFIPNPENKPYVDHINHIRNDDRVENLRWVYDFENQRNRIKKEDITPEIAEWLKFGRENTRKYNNRKKQN